MQSEENGALLSDIASEQLHWLWEKRIPRGKLTTLDGDPGLGKSLLTLDLAARITTGRSMPDGTPGVKGNVVLIAPEDDANDTIKPRIEAAGGDPSHICLLDHINRVSLQYSKCSSRLRRDTMLHFERENRSTTKSSCQYQLQLTR